MSEIHVYIMPTIEIYIPDRGSIERITLLISHRNIANLKVLTERNDSVKFYDCGENFESIKCPICSNEIDIEWWQEAMGTAYENNFTDLHVSSPCCKNATSLNSLDYYFPQGFSMFAVRVEDYELDKFLLDDALFAELEKITGVGWKAVYCRY